MGNNDQGTLRLKPAQRMLHNDSERKLWVRAIKVVLDFPSTL